MRIESVVSAATDWLDEFGVRERGGGADAPKDHVLVIPSGRALFSMPKTEIVEFDPKTFKEVLDGALRLGKAVGRMPEAMEVIGEGERRLRALHDRLGRRRDGSLDGRDAPRVVVLERLKPLTIARRWVPDLVEMAGGEPVGLGTRPGDATWEALRCADPDVLVMAGQPDLSLLSSRSGWDGLRSVRSGRIHIFGDAPSLLHPGPTIYDAVERLAALLHPDLFG